MTPTSFLFLLFSLHLFLTGCISVPPKKIEKTAAQILGDPKYQAIAYGGYRQKSRDIQPSLEQLTEDLLILHAMGIRILRTYNVHLPHAANVLQVIRKLKEENEEFEMYVMLGAWIDCKNAWTGETPIHHEESERNALEIERAVELAQLYPDIVKIIAVGNEAMVKWATAYYVEPEIILKWVQYLQMKKKEGQLSESLWITSSDNFASWGGGGDEYHTPTLVELIHSVDFISIHTYPMHDTYYNPTFWLMDSSEIQMDESAELKLAMSKSIKYAQSQYNSVRNYLITHRIDKPIHIGETGWASHDSNFYGQNHSRACDELKSGMYYQLMRNWTDSAKISCFYFEAFDEQWKDEKNPEGSENHFGLFTLQGQAKYAIWSLVDAGYFDDLERDGFPIVKTHNGDSLVMARNYMRVPIQSK